MTVLKLKSLIWPAVLCVFAVLCLSPFSAYAACTNPAGGAGKIVYDSNLSTMAYCNDTSWITMGSNPLDAGLAGYWKLDDGSGTTAKDSSGHGFNDTLAGGSSWVSGVIGGGMASGGQLANASLSPYLTTSGVTVAGWMKMASNVNYRQIAQGWLWGSSTGSWTLFTDSAGYAYFGVMSGPSTQVTANAPAVVLNTWQHYAGTYDGTTLRLYVNGAQVATTVSAGISLDTSNGVSVANSSGASFDDIRVYSRALSASEVASLYNMKTGCTSPAGSEGKIIFSSNRGNPAYCNGADWVNMDPSYKPVTITKTTSNQMTANTSSMTGLPANITKMTGSLWFRRNNVSNSSQQFLYSSNSNLRIRLTSTNKIEIYGTDSSSQIAINYNSTPSYTDFNWHHLLFSFDIANSLLSVYVDNAAVAMGGTINASRVINLDTFLSIGSNSALNHFEGDLADMWFDFNTYTDFSVSANRAKFIDANNYPVSLGATGNIPTGSAPNIFMSGAVASWQTNKGSSGGFTLTGTLAAGSAIPKAGTSPETGCTSPAGTSGKMVYDSGTNIMAYCNGSDWVKIGG